MRYRLGSASACLAGVLIAALLLLPAPQGRAAQSSLSLPTTGVFNGLTEQNNINAALNALNTCNSGNVAPTNALGGAPVEGQCWLDTTSSTLKILKRYTGSGWAVEGVLDVANGLWSPPVGGGTASVASASTTNLCTSPQSVQTVTGTTTITSFGSSCVAGQRKTLVFSGALTLTYNATSMILPGAGSIIVAAGDVAEAIYLGSGNWRVVSYVPLVGTVVNSVAGRTGVLTLSHGLTNSSNDLQIDVASIANHIGGLTLSTAVASSTVTIAVGAATDSGNVDLMKLTSALNKHTGSWAVGHNSGGLDTGTIAVSSWYHVYLIKRPDTGVVDACITATFGTGCAAGVGNIPAAYTEKRWLGGIKTDASNNWTRFYQIGDEFIWDVPAPDVNLTATTPNANYALSVPPGVSVMAHVEMNFRSSSTGAFVVVHSPLGNSQTPGTPSGNVTASVIVANIDSYSVVNVLTDTSRQIHATGNGVGSNNFVLTTTGWRVFR
ncbi:hypothetical protein PMI42_00698 [Bradyrhizobium sp. YR681]|uniref:hypothetical protein n=1 Tax=Bradyrhizobium sp. YR681 TaxID=1144344 RepID=UPI000270DED2|nr:hypothetical protein [Bradyrhizobium sp. YR681]EJN15681.1 hypothetical protein PMI42_00698 [Bradyrhizobium sp. YR681]